MGNSNIITVETELGKVEVHKMPLADYAQLLGALDKLPQHIAELVEKTGKKSVDSGTILSMLPSLLADSFQELAAVLAVTTDKDADFILQLDLADVIDIVGGALEVNNFERIQASIKKMQALRAKPTVPEKAS